MAPLTPSCTAPLVAVAGLSARMLARSAAQAGLRVAALDAFGDRDTRAASSIWFDVAGPGLSIDRARVADALRRLARLPRMIGWIAGSGTEPFVDELAEARGLPPLIGNRAPAAAVRDPHRFFALLDALGIAHPAVSFARPPGPGWLFKRADGCGGTHIVRAGEARDGDIGRGYFQREAQGRACSALFLAARGKARVIGFAEQSSTAAGTLPYLYTGAIGPVALPAACAARVCDAIARICRETALVGLNSFDFLLNDDGDISVLEINARPSATMALYEAAWPQRWPLGLLAWHLDACRHGRLPGETGIDEGPPSTCVGQQVVFAPSALVCTQALSDACLADPACRDVPMPGTRIGAHEPLCTIVASARTPAAVRQALEHQRAAVLQRTETLYEPPNHAFVAYSA
ncbi:ATP-grasp domain-containing protein [Trinickia caryophylli]|uniref:Predicted ATP-dependent carboligase, ATP-grasp superfamily n=1 Tax=Trinickia caryophylli TaxID=28094 RepID=A0A1X7E2L1_TRICW|nr:ATP-grasp domain-containing protein [Trinickia caryophylli]PMS14017.1 ATP-binding protein [Trinickia caryophylli]TRX17710.1 ATP-grasp domain-containing protein [Trinickia caryophylli]WQE11530.1 ATP-grasp domain-containing protein [Trinickia caryophylli]SMF26254.1 Predicted ATP-dependent carboligase, ATP-grasp superfamily [Trinickia caryophylli]GLU32696.1 hypothetical protein Busp01_25380 [Trinickia caryophylli]